MNNDTYKYLHKDALTALCQKRLLPALESLSGMATSLGAWSAKEELEQLAASCRMLLTYMAKGANDPARETMYVSFLRRAFELSDALARQAELADADSFYTQSFRTLEQITGSTDLLAAQLPLTTDLRNLFDLLWLAGPLTRDDETEVANLLVEPSRPVEAKLLALSALTLSAIQFFDIAKYRLLLDNVLTDDDALRVRALVGLVFVHLFHHDRLGLYPEEGDRLLRLLSVPDFREELECLQTLLFVSLDAKRVAHNLQEEILPGMLKQMNTLKDEVLRNSADMPLDDDAAALNPEWLNEENVEKLNHFAEMFTDLRERGADLYLGAFRSFKGRFPFFRYVRNWFWPFTLNHPDVPKGVKLHGVTKAALADVQLCDSDKYSFFFLASQAASLPLPEAMSQALEEHCAEISEVKPTFAELLRSYVQDFYRFCHLYAHGGSFPNPFKLNLLLADTVPFDNLLDDSAYVRRMGDFVFNDKNYGMALRFYQAVPAAERSALLWQKVGYCYERQATQDSLAQAHHCYLRAHSLDVAPWTLRRLAHLDMAKGDYGTALTWFRQMEKITPDDVKMLLGLAECLVHTGKNEEALQCLFKAHYLAPESAQAIGALAWSLLLAGKYEQAEKYYGKILAAQPTKTDYLNAGHAAFLLGNTAEAVSRYLRAVTADTVYTFLEADSPMLQQAGLSETSLSLMAEAVALRFSEPDTNP